MCNTIFKGYHYCSIETFKDIMTSKVLWLSDLTNSNDEQEVGRTFINLWEGVKMRLKQTDLPRETLEQTVETLDNQYKVELIADTPYGICFCQSEDVLSQWKEYGDNTRGLSLGFDINWFINIGIRKQMPHPNGIQSNAIGYDSVIYHSREFEENISAMCYNVLKQYGPQSWLRYIRPTFKHYSGFVKNPTFNAEEEIRIVYYPENDLDFFIKDVSVSGLKKGVKDHYEIPWIKDGSQALKSICIGHNCTVTKGEILEVLRKNGIDTNIEMTESKCSYRLRD